MKLIGKVVGISKKGRVMIETPRGYTIADIHGTEELQMHQIVSGLLEEHGDVQLAVEGFPHEVDVYIEAVQASLDSALRLLQQN